MSIFWTYANEAAKITIEVHNATRLVSTLTTSASNSGRYTWRHSPTLSDGNYKIVIKATAESGAVLATAETGFFEITSDDDPDVGGGGNPIASANCPPVPSKTRTYNNPGIAGAPSRVTLRHYRYPETALIGQSVSFGERCVLSATPGTRTCPYTQSIYGSDEQVNTYSIMSRYPDALNDPSEVGDRQAYAYLKPIIGIKAANRAFDMSIPFRISEDRVGKTYDFVYSQNWTGPDPGQWSVSECEGDYSENAVVTGLEPKHIRLYFLATDDLEGSRSKVNGGKQLALKVGKTYYLNMRHIDTKRVPGDTAYTCLWNPDEEECYSPMVHTDELVDDSIWNDTLSAQFQPRYLEFYRWNVFEYNFPASSYFTMTTDIFQNDPFFREPGEAFIDYTLYNTECGEGTNAVLTRSLITGVNDRLLTLDNTLLDSQCKPVCGAPGYVVEGNKCVKN
jgi:hypothetical protein